MSTERQVEATLHVLVDRGRETDAARLGERLEPRRHVHAVAVDAFVLGGDVAEVETDAEQQAALRGQRRGAVAEHALQLEAAAHRIERGTELGEHVVARGIDHAAAMPLDAGGEGSRASASARIVAAWSSASSRV